MTKVHIAYDDVTLIGVYRNRKAAKRALNETATNHGGQSLGKWKTVEGGIEREVARHPHHYGWEQWIDTHELVQP